VGGSVGRADSDPAELPTVRAAPMHRSETEAMDDGALPLDVELV
jgi:hypothetical protein